MDQPSTARHAESAASPDAVDVGDQLLLLWRFRVAITVAAVTLGALAVVFSVIRPRQFEATATVSVSASRLNDQTPALVSPAAYVPLMTTQAVAAQVIAALSLPDTTPSQLLRSTISVRAVRNSNLVRVVARAPSAEQAATVANRFASEAVGAASRAGRIDAESIESELKLMLDASAERLAAAERAYDTYRTSAGFEMVEREVETLVDQRGNLMEVIVELESERARLAQLEADLAKLSPVTPLQQRVVDDPAATEAARGTALPARDLLALKMTSEAPNPVFQGVDEEASRTRARVAFLEQRRQRLAAVAGVNGSQLSRLSQLYERQSMLTRLQSERDLARASFEDASMRHQRTRLAAIGRTPQLIVVDPAVTPDRPLGRYTLRNLLLGLIAGSLLGCVVVLVREALTGARRA